MQQSQKQNALAYQNKMTPNNNGLLYVTHLFLVKAGGMINIDCAFYGI